MSTLESGLLFSFVGAIGVVKLTQYLTQDKQEKRQLVICGP
jgi:multisubunit Na+/H+ antiporter MnhG subunit